MIEHTRQKNKIIAYKNVQDTAVKVYVLQKGAEGFKVKAGKLDLNNFLKLKQDDAIDLMSKVNNKVYLIKESSDGVVIFTAQEKLQKIGLNQWKDKVRSGEYVPVNDINIEYKPGQVIEQQTVGNKLVGKIVTEASQGEAVLIQSYTASSIPSGGYRLDSYKVAGETVYIPPEIEIVDTETVFNGLEKAYEIKLQSESNLRVWNNKQFIGQLLEVVDLRSTSKLEKIGDESFKNCEQLEKVYISEDNTDLEIGKSAFENDTRLEHLNMQSVHKIESNAFKNTYYLIDIQNLDRLREIGENCFEGSGICGEIKLVDIVNFPKNQFKDCSNLRQLKIQLADATSCSIESEAISQNGSLEEIKISSDKADISIKSGAIIGNEVLRKLVIPGGQKLESRFLIEQPKIVFIGSKDDEYKYNTIILDSIQVEENTFSNLPNIKEMKLTNIKVQDGANHKFISNMQELYKVQIDGKEYLQDMQDNRRLWMQLKFCKDSGYRQDKVRGVKNNTFKFLWSKKADNVMVCKFNGKSIAYQILVKSDRSTQKMAAYQILDSQWKNDSELLEFQSELQIPEIVQG